MIMKKFNTILAIAAVALTSIFGFTSCEKDDPFVNPGPDTYFPGGPDNGVPGAKENQMLNGTLEYEFSADVLNMVSVSYEITDLNGTMETFEITQPGKGTKNLGSTKNLDAVAKVKVVVTPKAGLVDDMKDRCDLVFFSKVNGYMSFDNYPDEAFTVNNPDQLTKYNLGITRVNPQQFANKVAGTYEIVLKK